MKNEYKIWGIIQISTAIIGIAYEPAYWRVSFITLTAVAILCNYWALKNVALQGSPRFSVILKHLALILFTTMGWFTFLFVAGDFSNHDQMIFFGLYFSLPIGAISAGLWRMLVLLRRQDAHVPVPTETTRSGAGYSEADTAAKAARQGKTVTAKLFSKRIIVLFLVFGFLFIVMPFATSMFSAGTIRHGFPFTFYYFTSAPPPAFGATWTWPLLMLDLLVYYVVSVAFFMIRDLLAKRRKPQEDTRSSR